MNMYVFVGNVDQMLGEKKKHSEQTHYFINLHIHFLMYLYLILFQKGFEKIQCIF